MADCSNYEPLTNNISNPVLKNVVKYRNHRCLFAIREVCKYFNRKGIVREILKLETSKACKYTAISTKIIKGKANISSDVLL